MEAMKDGGADPLAHCSANMLDRKAVALIAIKSLDLRTYCLERILDTGLPLEARRMADNRAKWACENILELSGAAGTQSVFEEGCPDNRRTFQPHQQAQARLSTGTGWLRLLLAETRRTSASIGSGVGILPGILADLTGPLGDRVKKGLPESSLIAQLEGNLREIRETWGGRRSRW